jgi:hypothetical protein
MPNANIRANTITEKDTGRVVNIDGLVDDLNAAEVTTSTGTQSIGDALDRRVIYVDTIADLQALDTSGLVDGQSVTVASTGRSGCFLWNSSDLSQEVSEDTEKGIYVPPFNTSGAAGAWVRQYSGEQINVRWFGALGNSTGTEPNGADDTAAFKAAIKHARKTSSLIYAPTGRYRIEDRLFFGVLNESDANIIPTQTFNICQGLIGDGPESTFLVPGIGLNGGVVIDMTGLRHKFLKNFTILTFDEQNCPAVGILTARFFRPGIGAPTNNDWGEFYNVVVDKYFSVSPYFAHATEEIVVNQCKFRTDRNDAIGAWVSTSDILDTWPQATEASETELSFTTGPQSNLHQRHNDCDYYVGANSPTRGDVALCWIKGSLMTKISRPFFNNNAANIDGVRLDKDPGQAFTFGFSLTGANHHQTIRSGLRIMAANVGTVYTDNNRTVGFEDAEIVIEGFTNGLMAGWVDEDVIVNAPLVNCEIRSCRDLIWKESEAIESSYIGVRRDVITDNSNRVATNDFMLEKGGTLSRIDGYYAPPTIGATQEILVNRTGKAGLEIGSNETFFGDDFLKINNRGSSQFQFNYIGFYRNGVLEANIRRGGYFECNLSSGGLVLTDANGTKRRVGVNTDGTLFTTAAI